MRQYCRKLSSQTHPVTPAWGAPVFGFLGAALLEHDLESPTTATPEISPPVLTSSHAAASDTLHPRRFFVLLPKRSSRLTTFSHHQNEPNPEPESCSSEPETPASPGLFPWPPPCLAHMHAHPLRSRFPVRMKQTMRAPGVEMLEVSVSTLPCALGGDVVFSLLFTLHKLTNPCLRNGRKSLAWSPGRVRPHCL